MFTVYILRGATGRHYIGMTADLEGRLAQHRRGHTHTTQRLGGELELIVSRSFETKSEAAAVERQLKAWKQPTKAITYLKSDS